MIAGLALFRNWLWRVVAFSVLAALGALAAIAVSDGASGKPTPAPTTTATVTQPTLTQPTTTVTQPPPPQPTTTVAPPPTGLTRWPDHGGYTVVLQSLPSSAQAAAEATARRALAAGLSDVGVLDSSAYSSLHPGYLVVFAGIYASSAEAGAATGRAHAAGFPSAYSRQISP